jgi:CHAT domain-containing protein
MTLLTSKELSANAATAQTLLEILIARRALLLEELAALRRALWTLDTEEGVRQRRELMHAWEGLARVVLEGAGGEDREAYRWRLIEARSALERVQEDAAKLASDAHRREPTAPVRAADLLRALPEDARLVSYVSYYDYATGESPVRSYLAIVSRASEPTPRVFRLGSCALIDPVIEEWRARVVRDPRIEDREPADHRLPGARLRELLWDPIRPALEGAAFVFLVPDGEIHGVDFRALPAHDDTYLVETEPPMHHLAAERDLLRLVGRRYEGVSLLAVGDPEYDLDPGGRGPTARARTEAEAGRPVYRSPEATCANLRALRFTPLPGTLEEVREISSIWSRDRREAVILRGPQATEEAVKRLAPGSRVVHLATHGFLMNDKCTAGPFTDRDDADSSAADRLRQDNPLWLSGLALASANRRHQAAFDDTREDGILTADEIAALDLSSVEWVVLSSCASGHDGDYFYNEGVQGLHRAFHLAGAGAVITSLWPVEDEAARAWMTELYAARSSGLSTPEAMRQASLARIRALRAARQSAHPLHWAGFVAAGDWR